MKTITVNGNEYTLEFTFAAAEHKDLVNRMFKIMTMSYVAEDMKDLDDDVTVKNMLDGAARQVADTPETCRIAFLAGLLEHNPKTEEEAVAIMRGYMKENKLSYKKLFDEIKGWMEEDGFFDLSGLNDMIAEMYPETVEEKKPKKVPQDHKKKEVSTK
nr:MAG TPA: tail assembly chaperone protein [Bacteriophage sp.]